MKTAIYIILLICLPCLAKAQTNAAYKGGSGDGYSSAIVENVPMNIDGKIKASYKVYPNPVAHSEDINISSGTLLIEHVRITDISGKEVYDSQPNAKQCTLKTGELKSGAYLLAIQTGDKTSYHKLIIY